jgi:type II secretion system (T2SS) protein E/type II/IV secretion system protein
MSRPRQEVPRVGLVRPGIPSITEILLEAGVVTAEQIETALEHQRVAGVRVGEALVELGAASENDIGWALARQLGFTYLDLTPGALDPELVRSFPEGLLRRLLAVPIVRADNVLSVAFGDPTDREAIAELEHVAGMPVVPSVAVPSMIYRVLDQFAGARHEGQPRSGEAPHAHHAHRATLLREGSGAHLLAGQLRRALYAHANEIHYLPEGDEIRVLHRIGGRLVYAGAGPSSIAYLLLARLEALGGPPYDGEQTHVHGRAVCPLGDQDVLLDVSLLGGEAGLAITLGIREAGGVVPPLERLGFDPVDLACVRGVLDQPAGLVLLSGPARAGCSTTLASLLAAVSPEARRSVAFERVTGTPLPSPTRLALPPEQARRSWSEIVVGQNADIVALDDVFTGEDVAGVLASNASGRLMLATTDWSDSFALIDFLSSRPGGAQILADRLRLVIQQRMACFEPDAASEDPEAPRTRPVFDVLLVSEVLRDALRAGVPVAELRGMAAAEGHRDLGAQLHALVTAGQLSASEAARILS